MVNTNLNPPYDMGPFQWITNVSWSNHFFFFVVILFADNSSSGGGGIAPAMSLSLGAAGSSILDQTDVITRTGTISRTRSILAKLNPTFAPISLSGAVIQPPLFRPNLQRMTVIGYDLKKPIKTLAQAFDSSPIGSASGSIPNTNSSTFAGTIQLIEKTVIIGPVTAS